MSHGPNSTNDDDDTLPLRDALDAARLGLVKIEPLPAGTWERAQAAAALFAGLDGVERAVRVLKAVVGVLDRAVVDSDDRFAAAKEFGIGDLDVEAEIAKLLKNDLAKARELLREAQTVWAGHTTKENRR